MAPPLQIPLLWACLASSGDIGQPLPVEGSTWPVGHTYLVGAGKGWAAADEGSPGSQPKKGRGLGPSPFPPSVVLDLLQGEMGCRWEEVRRARRGHRCHQFHTHSIPTLSVVAPPVTA